MTRRVEQADAVMARRPDAAPEPLPDEAPALVVAVVRPLQPVPSCPRIAAWRRR